AITDIGNAVIISTSGIGGGGVSDHDDLINVTSDQHHTQAHILDGGDHTISGKIVGQTLTASGATTFGFSFPDSQYFIGTDWTDLTDTGETSLHSHADAPLSASYITISGNANLTHERILTGTANQITITDGGANGTVVLSTPQDIHTGASPTFAGLYINNQGELRFYDNGNYVGFEAGALSADQIWILPIADGNANDFLQTDGGGVLSWGLAPTVSGAGPVSAEYVVLSLDATLENERVLTGTANQVILADGGANGNVVLSLPQDIHVTASPTFSGLISHGQVLLDVTSTEALLVRKDDDGGDVFTGDTINSVAAIGGAVDINYTWKVHGKTYKTNYTDFAEIADPGAGAANKLRVYAIDDGSGVTGLQLTDSAGTDTFIGARTRTLNISLGAFTIHTGSP
ncbi:hypothetical protein LCGC14_2832430, partial [marine sediment metagenome]